MDNPSVFAAGESLLPVEGDPRRQAVASLRGYAYQLYVSALAWVGLQSGDVLYLEVAEDYVVLAGQHLRGVQVKDTAKSSTLTINNQDVLDALDSFVDLVERNPSRTVQLRYLTTSEIGRERDKGDQVNGEAVLLYWRKAAAVEDVEPLRKALLNSGASTRFKKFITSRTNGSERIFGQTNQSGVTRELAYQYDAEGNRRRITHPDGAYFVYAYDGLNRLTGITENGPSTTLATIAYDNQARRQTLTRGGGVISTAYGYDPVSRLQTLTQDLAGTAYDETRTFAYNPASQVTSRILNNGVYSYTQTANVTLNYKVNGLNQYTELASTATVLPTHDANGNMTSDGTPTTYTYDVLNRMIGATGSKTANLSYDPKGRLFQTSGGTTGTTQYLYDGSALVAEYDSAGTLQRRYVHGSGVDEPLIWYEGLELDRATGATTTSIIKAQ